MFLHWEKWFRYYYNAWPKRTPNNLLIIYGKIAEIFVKNLQNIYNKWKNCENEIPRKEDSKSSNSEKIKQFFKNCLSPICTENMSQLVKKIVQRFCMIFWKKRLQANVEIFTINPKLLKYLFISKNAQNIYLNILVSPGNISMFSFVWKI